MQSSITAFFKKPAIGSSKGVNKPSTKRTKALSPVAASALEKEASLKSPSKKLNDTPSKTAQKPDQALQQVAPTVRAKIEGNRAAARIKRLMSLKIDMTTKEGLEQSLEPSWKEALHHVLMQPYWSQLITFVSCERKSQTIYPPPHQVFAAFNHSVFSRTRVVIIGQDPYHGPRQAHGMCFSVPPGVYPPPSLVNIFQELTNDINGFERPKNNNGCLEKWANQGVLLLNSVLTVRRASAGSHQSRGWERFTDDVVRTLADRQGKGVVFMLWGGYAKKKGAGINRKKHCVLECVHPSPLSANRGGWFGNSHFSKANAFLEKTGQEPIDWKL